MIQIQRLQPHHAARYQHLRLRALQEHPEAFTSSFEEENLITPERWEEVMTERRIYGAFVDDRLVGVIGLSRERSVKTRHRMHLWGMYVAPEYRGQGVGERLLQAALDDACTTEGIEILQLAVTVGNHAARRLYRRAGFQSWGVDPQYIKIGELYYDVEWMMRHCR